MTVPGILDESGMIMTTQPIEWTFQCSFDASYDIEADEMTMDAAARTGDFVGTGQFDLSLDSYASDAFEIVTDGANQIGNTVNFGSKYSPNTTWYISILLIQDTFSQLNLKIGYFK